MRLTMLSKERVVQCQKLDDGCKEGLNVMIKTVASKMLNYRADHPTELKELAK